MVQGHWEKGEESQACEVLLLVASTPLGLFSKAKGSTLPGCPQMLVENPDSIAPPLDLLNWNTNVQTDILHL